MNDKTTESLSVSTVTVKIGDIFHTCWGYEQTNIEFYQVVSLHGKKTVGLCKIAGQIVEHTSWCSADVKPIKDAFMNDIIYKRRITAHGDHISLKFNEVTYAYRISPDRAYHYSWGY